MRLKSAARWAALPFCIALASCAPAATPTEPAFEGVLWRAADEAAAPGKFIAFLDDGVMAEGACLNPYRLSEWRRDGAEIVWSEDGVEIRAMISRNGDALSLTYVKPADLGRRNFVRAAAPFVCPDYPR